MSSTEAGGVGSDPLLAAIPLAWAADTSAAAEWSASNPALGQCAVTALVVQDRLGGDLRRATVGEVSHYWNAVDGGEIDLTRHQFPTFAPGAIETRSRDYVLSFPATRRRYEILTNQSVSYWTQRHAPI